MHSKYMEISRYRRRADLCSDFTRQKKSEKKERAGKCGIIFTRNFYNLPTARKVGAEQRFEPSEFRPKNDRISRNQPIFTQTRSPEGAEKGVSLPFPTKTPAVSNAMPSPKVLTKGLLLTNMPRNDANLLFPTKIDPEPGEQSKNDLCSTERD